MQHLCPWVQLPSSRWRFWWQLSCLMSADAYLHATVYCTCYLHSLFPFLFLANPWTEINRMETRQSHTKRVTITHEKWKLSASRSMPLCASLTWAAWSPCLAFLQSGYISPCKQLQDDKLDVLMKVYCTTKIYACTYKHLRITMTSKLSYI